MTESQNLEQAHWRSTRKLAICLRQSYNCISATISSVHVSRRHSIGTHDRELLARQFSQFRRAIWRDLLLGSVRTFGDVDFSFAQVVTLYMLDDVGEPTIKQVAETLGRSVSATSRLLDQLVERGLIGRREDKQDRRAKRVFLKEEGWTFLRTFEQNRADAQVALMVYLAPEEQAQVAQAMALLAEAARRYAQTDTSNANPGARCT